MEDMDSDGMEEDEQALLEEMDAEDAAAADMDKNDSIAEGEPINSEGMLS